jgi:hypothetical protein
VTPVALAFQPKDVAKAPLARAACPTAVA